MNYPIGLSRFRNSFGDIGVLGMKSKGDGVIQKSKAVSPMECLHRAISLPTSVVITGIHQLAILDQAIEAAKTFKLMTRKQVAQVLAKTKEVAVAGKCELFKTSSHSIPRQKIRIGWAVTRLRSNNWHRPPG